MDWASWVRDVTGGASARQIALRIHRGHTSMQRWLRTGDPPAEVVIDVARAYQADPIAGLLAAGCLSKDELVPHLRSVLRYTPLTFLTDEVHERAVVWERVTARGGEFEEWWAVPEPEPVEG